MASFVTTEELKWFHNIDRQIFTRMVVNLGFDTLQSTKLVALWIWIETMGFPNMVFELLSKADAVVSSVAKEGSICIKYIEEHQHTSQLDIDLPVTTNLFGKRISMGFLHENRVKALYAISRMVNDNLSRAFEDIVENVHGRRTEREKERSMRSAAASNDNANVATDLRMNLMNGLVRKQGEQQALHLNPTAQPWNPNHDVPEERRTMFVTFSRGYAVSEDEVIEFFTSLYGDCVEGIHMEEVSPLEQPLFARVVFQTASTIPIILDGQAKAKYIINGKHVWMRKFAPKHVRV